MTGLEGRVIDDLTKYLEIKLVTLAARSSPGNLGPSEPTTYPGFQPTIPS
jgi:hypothetical protein